jgi:hypothetical protein
VKAGTRALGVAESYVGTAGDGADGADGADAVDSNAGAGSRRDGTGAPGQGPQSVLAGAVVRADRVVDGLSFGTCTVGGTDATGAVARLFAALDREDVRYLLVAGVAPAWFNLVDLDRLRDAVDRPVISVSFEASPGLSGALRDQFAGEELADRLATYRSLPPRRRVDVGDDDVFVRSVGVDADEAARVVRAFTPTGGRPEPLRVARLAARGAREWRDRAPVGPDGDPDGPAHGP